jgi:hypothetical protein
MLSLLVCETFHVALWHCIDDGTASCCNEAFKIATSSAAWLNNYFMLIGTDGVYSYTFEHEKRNDCPVCGGETVRISVSREWTVDRFIEMLVERQDMYVALLQAIWRIAVTYLLFVAKSRNLLSHMVQSRFISKRHPNLSRLHVQIWRRSFPILFPMARIFLSRLLPYHSASL